MKKLLFVLLLINFINCKKESNPVQVSNTIDSVVLNSETTYDLVKSETTQGAWFQAKVPKGFAIEPSVPSATATKDYDSYFYSSPDGLAKFYVYSPQGIGTPNDIVFPNEKIAVETIENSDGSISRHWTLPPNQQHPYFRSFTEIKNESSIIISGFYYKDEAAKEKYSAAYEEFKSSIKPLTH